MARLNVASDACDGARGLHRGDEMVEEALLGALECRSRRRFRLRIERAMLGARHPRRLHRRGEIVVDDLEGTGIAVVDASLLVDRTSVVEGKSVSVRVDLGGRRIIKKKRKHK